MMANESGQTSPRRVQLLLALLVLLLVCFQYVTLVKFNVFPPGASHLSFLRFFKAAQEQVDLTFVDAALFGLILLVCLSLILLELWQKRLSFFLQHILASERRTLLLLGASSLVFVRFYFATGEFSWAGDSSQHISYAFITAQAFSRGEIPIWTFYFGNGSPYLQFYGFLFFYAAGLVDLFCRDLFVSLKLLMGITHVVSGVGMYLLIRTACRSRRAGLLAGLAYVLSFWHTQQVLIMGRFPLSLFYALLPWPFYFVERLSLPRHRVLAATGGGLTLAMLLFTHPGYGFFSTFFIAVYLVLRLWTWRRRKCFRSALVHGLVLFLGGVLFSAYLTVGMWAERGSTNLHAQTLGIDLGNIASEQPVPDPTWRHVLVWSNFRFWLWAPAQKHWYGGYLGITLVLLALAGLSIPAWPRFRKSAVPFLAGSVCLLIAFLLVFAYRSPPLRVLLFVQAMNSARYLLFLVFFLAFMVGMGTRSLLLLRRGGFDRDRLFTLLLVGVVIDLGTTTFQHPYKSPHATPIGVPLSFYTDFRKEAEEYQSRGELPNFRIAWAMGDTNPYLAMSRLQFMTLTPTPDAPHPGDLRALDAFYRPFERMASMVLGDLPDPDQISSIEDSDLISAGLGLLNSKYILGPPSDGYIHIFKRKVHTPILVSPRISPFPTAKIDQAIAQGKVDYLLERDLANQLLPAFWIIHHTGVDLQNNACERIFLVDGEEEVDLGTRPTARVLDHRVWNQRVELHVRVSAPCFARLAYAYFPYLGLSVDGQPVRLLQTAGRFIALPLDPGEHRIVLEARLSPLRKGLLCLALFLLAVGAWSAVREHRRASSLSGFSPVLDR